MIRHYRMITVHLQNKYSLKLNHRCSRPDVNDQCSTFNDLMTPIVNNNSVTAIRPFERYSQPFIIQSAAIKGPASISCRKTTAPIASTWPKAWLTAVPFCCSVLCVNLTLLFNADGRSRFPPHSFRQLPRRRQMFLLPEGVGGLGTRGWPCVCTSCAQ